MKYSCPNCSKALKESHTFCPECGYDLRNKETKVISVPSYQDSYWKGFSWGLTFCVFSIFIWSYVYANYSFNFDVFLGRLLNHTFWVLFLPWIISVFFKKPKRYEVHRKLVKAAIVIGIVFLGLHYATWSNSNDPYMQRINLKNQCKEGVLAEEKNSGINYKANYAELFCECLSNGLSDATVIEIVQGNDPNLFGTKLRGEYKALVNKCVQESLSE